MAENTTSISEPVCQPAMPFVFTLRYSWKGIALALLTAVLYSQVLVRMAEQWWQDSNSSHGFVIPLVSAWLVWERRQELSRLAMRPSNLGLMGIAGGLLVLLAGILGSELFLSRISLVILIGGLVVFHLGWNWLRALLFPWLLLLMMIPVPAILFNQIAFPLQLFASHLAGSLLSLCGVPVLREGNIITLAAMQLEVVEACSGIRSLMTLGSLACIYGYLVEQSNVRRVLLAFSAIPIAIAANALRIFGTGLCVQYWDASKAEGFFHEFSGWVVFVVAFALLLASHAVIRLIAPAGTRSA